MRPYFLIVLTLTLGFFQSAAGQKTVNGAGIVALACKGSTALYLLARERSSDRLGWSHLGGTKEGDEPFPATALREFHEESNCAFDLDNPPSLRLSEPSKQKTKDGLFVTYHMKVNYLPVMRISNSDICKTNERDHWVWVRRTDLLASLGSTAQEVDVPVAEGEPSTIRLWQPAAAALRQAVTDKVIPEADPCVP